MEFDYTRTTAKEFDDAIRSVETEIANAGMRVLHVHNVQQTLADKGFPRGPFKIIEFCNASYASALLKADIKIGLCMPCKINVYAEDGAVRVSGMRPVVLSHFFPNASLGTKPQELDTIVRAIIDAVT